MPRPVSLTAVIPIFNRLELAVHAVRSVVHQTFHDIEILLVDDGTPGGISQIADAVGDPRVRIVTHSVRRGAAAARNTGVLEARADLIAFLDSDDSWRPGMVEALLLEMSRAGPDCAGATTGFMLHGHGWAERRPDPPPTGDLLALALRGCPLAPGSTLVIRRSVWENLGGLDEQMKRLEDWDLLLRLAKAGWDLSYVDEVLVDVRRSVPGPQPLVVERSCQRLLSKHGAWVNERSPTGGRHLKAALTYEVGLANLRHAAPIPALCGLLASFLLDPVGRITPLRRSLRRYRLAKRNHPR